MPPKGQKTASSRQPASQSDVAPQTRKRKQRHGHNATPPTKRHVAQIQTTLAFSNVCAPPSSDLGESGDQPNDHTYCLVAASGDQPVASDQPHESGDQPNQDRKVVATLDDHTHCLVAATTPAAPTDYATVSSLRDIFHWPRAYLSSLSTLGIYHTDIHARMTEISTWSDAFAGVSCDVVSLNMLDAELLRQNNWSEDNDQPLLTHCWAIEWDSQCIYEQRMLPHDGPGCIFGNILDFATPLCRQELAGLKASGAELADYVAACNKPSAVTCSAECKVHGRTCTATVTGGHCSGCPCTDFTLWGSCRRLSGPTMPFLAMWMRLMIILGLPFIILENVPQFPIEVLEAYMGFMYSIYDAVIDNTQFGHVVRRQRRYILLLKKTIWALTRPLSDVATVFARRAAPEMSFDVLFCAKSCELDCELMWARSRSEECRKVPLSGDRTRSDFINALNDNERERLDRYLKEYQCEGSRKVCMLSQDPDFRGVQSSEDILATLVRQCHILWSDHHGRWLTGRELLLAQSFPITDATLRCCQEGRATVKPLCSYNCGRISRNLPPRSRTDMAKQAGNSMCTNAIGAIITFSAAFTKRHCSVEIPRSPATPMTSSALQMWSKRSSLSSLVSGASCASDHHSAETPCSDAGSSCTMSSVMSDALSLWSSARAAAAKRLRFD